MQFGALRNQAQQINSARAEDNKIDHNEQRERDAQLDSAVR